MSITGLQILERMIDKGGLGIYMPNAEIDSIAAALLTSTLHLRNENWGAQQHESISSLLYRPGAASAADYVRYVSSSSTNAGAVVPDADWADVTLTSEDIAMLHGGIHPTWLLRAINRGMGGVYDENIEPLSAKPSGAVLQDAGFQSSATTQYVESDTDGGPTMTFSKVTTANSENVFQGIGSGRGLNTQDGGYFRQRFNVTQREPVVMHALSRLASGTAAQLLLRDVTGSANIGTTVEHDEGAWQWMRRLETIPDDSKILEVRWQGSGASADVYWGGHSILFPNQARVILDTKWDTEFKMPSLVSVDMAGDSPATGVFPAMSARYTEIPRTDYSFLFNRQGANPYAVQFHNGTQQHWFQKPVMIQGRRAYSDFTTFTLALSETTGADLDLIASAALVEAFLDQRIAERVSNPETRLADAYGYFLEQKRQFQQRGPAQRKQPWSMPRAMN